MPQPKHFFMLVVALWLPLVIPSGGAHQAADNLDGTWLISTAELAGKPLPEEISKATKLVIKSNAYTVTVGDSPHDKGTVKTNPSAKPKTLDIIGVEGPNKGKTILCIYVHDGDSLRVCYDLSGKTRPAEFKTTEGSQLFLVMYKRQGE